MSVDQQKAESIGALIRRKYPDWSGFDDARFVREQTAPLRSAAERAAESLGWTALEALRARGDFAEVIARVERLGRATNLLYKGRPESGDLAMLNHESLDRRAFAEQLIELLHGTAESPIRLERFVRWGLSHGLPVKWPLPTYLLMLCHPGTDLFIKSRWTSWLMAYLDPGSSWSGTPGAAAYTAVLGVANELRETFEPSGARDFIDVLAAIRVAAREATATRYWKVSPGEDAWQWKQCRSGGFIGVGWELFGDISDLDRAGFDRRHREILKTFPELKNSRGWKKRDVAQLWQFAHIKPGDVIVANRGANEILGTGTVTGSYFFLSGERNGHRLPVAWHSRPPFEIEAQRWNRPVVEIAPELVPDTPEKSPGTAPARVAEPGSSYRTDAFSESAKPAMHPLITLDDIAGETGFERDDLDEWASAIERKRQAVLYGPPGTGKTYLAEHLAAHIIGGGDGILELVQFHPGYSYEEFVTGMRPQSRDDGTLHYPMVPGRFVEFCRRAAGRTGRSVMVIDELNRADLPRVFGELLYMIEYRDREISLAGGERFSIPANVRIIGTMNTADRSIALVDNALRRRFAFIAVMPDYDVLRRYHKRLNTGFEIEKLVALLRRINAEIGDANHALGISYFLREDLARELPAIWRTEIEPYLDEYFFDRPERAREFRWEVVGGSVGE